MYVQFTSGVYWGGNVDDVPNKNENDAMFSGKRLEGKFVGKNAIKLPRRNLSSAKISDLPKGLKFAPTATSIDQAKLKRELDKKARNLA